MKMRQRAMCYLQDSEVLESSEVHLGDPGNIISVQVTGIESTFGSDFFAGYTYDLFNSNWLEGMLLVKQKVIPVINVIP